MVLGVGDRRSTRIFFVAHCILNQNTIASGLVKRHSSAVWEILELFREFDVGIEQLPCPEFMLLGLPRPPMTKTQYELEGLRKICIKLSEEITSYMFKLLRAGFKILGILGIERSPSCGVHQIYIGYSPERAELIEGCGIFIEELTQKMKERGLNVPVFSWDYKDEYKSLKILDEYLSRVCGRIT